MRRPSRLVLAAAFFPSPLAAAMIAASALAPSAFASATQESLEMEIAPPRLPGRLEGISNFYFDDHGLYVSSTGAVVEHPLGSRLALKLKALADWIGLYPPDSYIDEHAGHIPGGGHGHHDPDLEDPDLVADGISGASVRASGSGGSQETRGEIGAGLAYRGRQGGQPLFLSAEARASHEPDYESLSAHASGSLDLFQGNIKVSGHAGFGIDRIFPELASSASGADWPAYQAKLSAGAALAQLVTARSVATAGFSAALQQGRLESPYRKALVVTTLFPERMPAERLRLTAFAQGSIHLGLGAALHSRQGFYWDTWNVRAWIPETALAKELGSRFLLTAKHRYYVQRRADFYKTAYGPADRIRSGDPRLGGLDEHTGGLELDWRFLAAAGGRGPFVVSAGYSFSYLEYWEIPGHYLTSQMLRLGATLDY